ncbi:hypothetical protein R3P38DRAFT_1717846 [Favolaschia claudopus]|uniref:Uncharacterized protein n=1 Tax=Favolaschia claudopus TaxID=2862362 RepID=A0AAW0AA12_9AGAR
MPFSLSPTLNKFEQFLFTPLRLGSWNKASPPTTQPPAHSPLLESDIGLHGSMPGITTTIRVTYSYLEWPSSPKLGCDEHGGKFSRTRANTLRNRTIHRRQADQHFASISQVLEPHLPLVDGREIRVVDIFSKGAGLGLGLTAAPALTDDTRSTDECRIVPITEVAPGSLARERLHSQALATLTAAPTSDASRDDPSDPHVAQAVQKLRKSSLPLSPGIPKVSRPRSQSSPPGFSRPSLPLVPEAFSREGAKSKSESEVRGSGGTEEEQGRMATSVQNPNLKSRPPLPRMFPIVLLAAKLVLKEESKVRQMEGSNGGVEATSPCM